MPSTGPAGSNMSSTLLGRASPRRRAQTEATRGDAEPTGGEPEAEPTMSTGLTNGAGAGATARTARPRRPRSAPGARAADPPATSSRSMGSTSRDSIFRRPGRDATPLADATGRRVPTRRWRRFERRGRRPARRHSPSTSRSRFSTNWPQQLRGHVVEHAAPELRDLAGDRQVGHDVDACPAVVVVHRDEDRRLRIALPARVATRCVDHDPPAGLVDLGQASRCPCTAR